MLVDELLERTRAADEEALSDDKHLEQVTGVSLLTQRDAEADQGQPHCVLPDVG